MTDQGTPTAPDGATPPPEPGGAGQPEAPAAPAVPSQPAPAAAPPPSWQTGAAAQPAPATQWQVPAEDAGPAPGIEFAPHGSRLVAYIIDSIIVGIVVSLLLAVSFGAIVPGMRFDQVSDTVDVDSISSGQWLLFAIMVVLATLVGLLYFPFFWARSGQTPGMRPFDLRVVHDRDGSPIGWGTAFLRLIGLWVAGVVFYLGYIWIFIDKRHRGWQDLIAGTVMIKRP